MLFGALLVASCAHSKIPNTTIDDTPQNREILKVVEGYHRALESRDGEALLALVSPRYFEDNGNVTPDDDYDIEQLRKGIREEFEHTPKIQLNLKVEDIFVDEEKDTAHAFVLYELRAQTDFPSGTKWKTSSERARFVFERRNNRWLLLSGI